MEKKNKLKIKKLKTVFKKKINIIKKIASIFRRYLELE